MTDSEWFVWAEKYGELFGLHTDADAAMVNGWRAKVDMFQAEALAEATATVAEQRAEEKARDQARLEKWRKYKKYVHVFDCDICSDTGIVTVAHPRFVQGGRWFAEGHWYTAAVTCRCDRGQRAWQQAYNYCEEKKRRAPMTLDNIETLCPAWRQQMAAQERIMEHEKNLKEISKRAKGSTTNPFAVLESRADLN